MHFPHASSFISLHYCYSRQLQSAIRKNYIAFFCSEEKSQFQFRSTQEQIYFPSKKNALTTSLLPSLLVTTHTRIVIVTTHHTHTERCIVYFRSKFDRSRTSGNKMKATNNFTKCNLHHHKSSEVDKITETWHNHTFIGISLLPQFCWMSRRVSHSVGEDIYKNITLHSFARVCGWIDDKSDKKLWMKDFCRQTIYSQHTDDLSSRCLLSPHVSSRLIKSKDFCTLLHSKNIAIVRT